MKRSTTDGVSFHPSFVLIAFGGNPMRNIRRAFSLVELLVTIAIIGVLMSLLAVAISHARASARRAQCLNNLRQLALGTRIYADRHGGYFPDGEDQPWFMQIAPCLSSEPTVFRCPDDPQQSQQSYSFRDESAALPEASLAGHKIDFLATGELAMLFDTAPDWHVSGHLNVAMVSGSALTMDTTDFEDNLLLSAKRGTFLDMELPPGEVPETVE